MSHLLTPDEVAERLRVSVRTVYEWLRTGVVPAKKFGGVWRVDEHELSASALLTNETTTGDRPDSQ